MTWWWMLLIYKTLGSCWQGLDHVHVAKVILYLVALATSKGLKFEPSSMVCLDFFLLKNCSLLRSFPN